MTDHTRQPSTPLRRLGLISSGLFLLLGIVFLLALIWGSSGAKPLQVISTLLGKDSSVAGTIIWQIRFPRAMLAALVGAALGLGGVVFQALLRNPLAEPYILGISGGAAVGAILGMILGLSLCPGVAGLAFAGSMATLALVLFISSGRKTLQETGLLLAGVMINAFCSSIIMFLISIVQTDRLHNVLYWLMGDLSGSSQLQALPLLALLVPCFVFIFLMARPMNLLLMGRETAKSLGVRVTATTLALLSVTSLMVSATVALSGLVGFVGLVIPHILRLLLGPDHRVLVPGCVLTGAAFLTGCDLLARTLPTQGEMPVGVVTALIGAPAFIILLYRSKA
ncbi:MAG: iron ABC transporter permease [Desulfohalobiaceae bacterium]|nr:iron ABC transporter permease [Desulfohalobiaceae bacterium]